MKIELENLKIRFSNTEINIKNKFEFKAGINLITGSNGQGKTTLLNCIYKDERYDGKIIIDGCNLAEVSKSDIRRKISYVPQTPVLFMNLTVLMNAKMLGVDIKRFKTYINLFKKTKILGKKCNSISGGELQIVNLSLGLAKDSNYLLIDEPLNNISVINKKRVLDLLATEQRSMIVISHLDLELDCLRISLANEELRFV